MEELEELEKLEEERPCEVMPIVALRGLTVFPQLIIHFDLNREKSIAAVEQAMKEEGQRLFLTAQKDLQTADPGLEDLYPVGTVARIRQVTRMPDRVVRVLVEGESRAQLLEILQKEPCLVGSCKPLSDVGEPEGVAQKAYMVYVKELLALYTRYYPKVGKAVGMHLDKIRTLGQLIDEIVMNMPADYQKKQEILEETNVLLRYHLAADLLKDEVDIARIKSELSEGVKKRVENNQRDYILREQLGYIRKELGDDTTDSDADRYLEAVEKLKAPKEVKEKIRKEIGRFQNLSPSSSESAVERTYIETLLDLPWNNKSKDDTDLDHAEDIINRDHYGLKQVKERMLEFLAVRSLTKKGDAPILCLVGPPGTGKTSIARSVAEALNKKYVRVCLGGVRDEAEIRGHRRTYVGALPGRIVQGLQQAGVKNPLMLLDEIDKVGSDHKGDTASALLEVLDSEQNAHFRDHYIEVPIDLSEVFFIATANTTETIPRPLLDRMELIEVNSYTANEKFQIAKRHLLAKQLKKNGLDKKMLSVSDSALKAIIDGYTREAGVRELERKIGEICRKTAYAVLKKKKTAVRVTAGNIEQYLGKVKYRPDHKNERDEVGIVRGLAWTSVGGETLQIEVNQMPGKGELELTGQLGDVMKESALTAISYVRSVADGYRVPEDCFKDNDFHIHIPEGAVPKDGPSAGITMATAMLSSVTGIPVKADLAMTGEVTLRGKVLPVGGLKEKLLAALTAGISTVIVPAENRSDIEEISKEITGGLTIHYVESMKEVAALAFGKRKGAKK